MKFLQGKALIIILFISTKLPRKMIRDRGIMRNEIRKDIQKYHNSQHSQQRWFELNSTDFSLVNSGIKFTTSILARDSIIRAELMIAEVFGRLHRPLFLYSLVVRLSLICNFKKII